uniref:Uncharacterized protein n=1 Tax=Rhipicephalus appendiculatus TaxID=34631 RepID=A0A131YGA8_RHIAP
MKLTLLCCKLTSRTLYLGVIPAIAELLRYIKVQVSLKQCCYFSFKCFSFSCNSGFHLFYPALHCRCVTVLHREALQFFLAMCSACMFSMQHL